MRAVHSGPLTVLPGVAALLALLTAAVGLGVPALATALVLTVALWLLLELGMRRDGLAELGPANTVTLVRAALVIAVASLVVQSWSTEVPRFLIVAMSAVALSLDLVDGRMARVRGCVTRLGAAFDMETDAFLILVLSLYVVPIAGAWVLLIGLARYLLLFATAVWPWLGGPMPLRPWAKVVAAVQGVVLVVAASEVLPTPAAQVLLLAALALLVESFGREIIALWGRRHENQIPRSPLVSPVLNTVALVVVWLALVVPQRPEQLTAAVLLGIPVELLVFLGLALVLPSVWGRVVAALAGVMLALVVVGSVLNLGFYEAFDRPFNPLTDPGYLGSGLDLMRASLGRGGEIVVSGLIVLGFAAGIAVCVWSVLRTRRTVRSAPRVWTPVLVALALVWAVAGVGGARVGGIPVAGTPAASLVSDQVDEVRAELRDRAVFEQDLTHDAYALTPGRDLLTHLRGKDVLVVFVESYGRVAVEDSWFAPQIDRTLTSADARLGRLGFHSRSGWLESPTFGGISWLAHSTLQSGLWIDSQQRYDQVLGTDRLTLVLRVREGRLAHRGRRPVQLARVARGQAVLRLPPDVRLLRRRVRRPAPGLFARPRPVHPARLRRPRAEDPPAAGDGRDRPRLEPRPVDVPAPAGAVGLARRRHDLQHRARRRRPLRHLAALHARPSPRPAEPLRPLDPLLPAVAGLVRAPLPRQEAGDGRAR